MFGRAIGFQFSTITKARLGSAPMDTETAPRPEILRLDEGKSFVDAVTRTNQVPADSVPLAQGRNRVGPPRGRVRCAAGTWGLFSGGHVCRSAGSSGEDLCPSPPETGPGRISHGQS